MLTLCKDLIVSQETGKQCNEGIWHGVANRYMQGNLPTHFVNQHLLGVMPTAQSQL